MKIWRIILTILYFPLFAVMQLIPNPKSADAFEWVVVIGSIVLVIVLIVNWIANIILAI